jgi:hypothetical protein
VKAEFVYVTSRHQAVDENLRNQADRSSPQTLGSC